MVSHPLVSPFAAPMYMEESSAVGKVVSEVTLGKMRWSHSRDAYQDVRTSLEGSSVCPRLNMVPLVQVGSQSLQGVIQLLQRCRAMQAGG